MSQNTQHSGLGADDPEIRALIAAAAEAAGRGQLQSASQLFRQAEARAPRHPLVLNQIALQAMGAGDFNAAESLLEQAIETEPSNAELWFNLASALKAKGRVAEAVAAIDRVLELNPRSIPAMLEKGALEDAQGNLRAAAMSYRTALGMMPPGSRPPPMLEQAIRRAKEVVEANNRNLSAVVAGELADLRRRFHNVPLERFDQCVDIMLQKREIYRQQPTFMYFPELPTIEFYPRELFPQLDQLEAAAGEIRRELLDVLSDGSDVLDPYISAPRADPAAQWEELNNSRRWGAYHFWNEGREYADHIARCPRTVESLRAWPLWDIPGNGPSAMFSILEPRTRIPAHTGTANTRLVVHLPLVVPPDCGFRVGGQTREWIPGEAFVFDDSINHEAWNNSGQTRAVLIFTIWSPFISNEERELVRALTTSIGNYYATADQSAEAHR